MTYDSLQCRKPAGGAARQVVLLVLWPVEEAKPLETTRIDCPASAKELVRFSASGASAAPWSRGTNARMLPSADMLLLSASAGGAGASTNYRATQIQHAA